MLRLALLIATILSSGAAISAPGAPVHRCTTCGSGLRDQGLGVGTRCTTCGAPGTPDAIRMLKPSRMGVLEPSSPTRKRARVLQPQLRGGAGAADPEESRNTRARARRSSPSPPPYQGTGPVVTAQPHSTPRDLDTLSAVEVGTLLWNLELGKYETRFRECPLNGAMLAKVNDADLVEVGVEVGVHRKELLHRIREFLASGVPQEKLVRPHTFTPVMFF